MAFNMQTFKTRALTAVVFVVVMLAGLLWNQWSFLLLFSVVHVGCWIEFQKLAGLIDPDYKGISIVHKYSIIVAGVGFVCWMTDNSFQVFGLLLNWFGFLLFVVGMIVFVLAAVLFPGRDKPRLLIHSLLGFLYLSVSCGLMMRLWGNMQQTVFSGQSWLMPVVLIAAIWINDTMAYMVGSFIGKTPFSPISPKKTWEGTAGGAILAVLAVTLVGHFSFGFPIRSLMIISMVAAVAGTAGDLFESKLKRMAGVKDSGNFMPGHGGFLDRFDSLLVATTVTWLVFSLVN